ncbi:PH domain-containing protein [Pontibacter ramchanderi]|uniref:PH (Pleckstrin Homology) domain-containing protein n=1 Tax=Pontibacter ramchanderi TaxID=1179743 RepID=A0A2N3UCG3_9BACT|nr:PH domain-containing protein [Pontibacter ramchanderi]PKV67088.1 PH (Pleckstrin Homology) domain-containing protein [Pontibacter ramchanderi]
MDQPKVYAAKRSGLIRFLLVGMLLLPAAVFLLDREAFAEKPFMLLPLLAPIGLIAWIYLNTAYWLEDDKLRYKSGPWKGAVEVEKITQIVEGRTQWVGMKPALATKGLVIRYNRFDELYIAPGSNQEVIADLLAINPDIQVVKQ